MRCEQDIAGQGLQHGKAVMEVLHCVRIILTARESEALGRYGCQAIGVDDRLAAILLTLSPGPGSSASGMSGRKVSRQGKRPHMHGLTVPQHAAILYR